MRSSDIKQKRKVRNKSYDILLPSERQGILQGRRWKGMRTGRTELVLDSSDVNLLGNTSVLHSVGIAQARNENTRICISNECITIFLDIADLELKKTDA